MRINSTHCVLYSELSQLEQKQDLKLRSNNLDCYFWKYQNKNKIINADPEHLSWTIAHPRGGGGGGVTLTQVGYPPASINL